MNPTAIYSKSGKGVQEASGKTSNLSRGDRAVLSAFDGKAVISEIAERVGKPFDPKFEQLVVQLEKDGYIREVSAGTAPAGAAKPAAPARPGTTAKAPGEELDFTAMIGAAKPAAPAKPPVDLAAKARAGEEQRAKDEAANSYKARQEAEARAKAEADARAKAANQARIQAEAANKAKAEAEAKARAAESEAKVRAEADAKVKAAREAALRAAADAKAKAEAEMNAKLEAERAKAREETERFRKETEEKARKESEELRQRLEDERKAREEADKARLEAERKAKEAEDRRRKEEDERRAREEKERKEREEAEKARAEAEKKAREAEERRRKEEDERRAREEKERAERQREEQERKEREEAERKTREAEDRRRKEEDERRAREEKERAEAAKADKDRAEKERTEKERAARADKDRAEKEKAEKESAEREKAAREKAEKEKAEKSKAPAAPAGDFSDSLLADLDSFGQREEEERKEKEEAERKAKEEAARKAKAEAERREKEEAELRQKEEAERKAKADAERKAKEEAEARAREEEERAKREAEERKRKARETMTAKQGGTANATAPAAGGDDIGVTDDDLDMDEVKRDEQNISKESRKAARDREREREQEKERALAAEEGPASGAPTRIRRPMKWGKPIALTLFVVLVAALGMIHVMPISTAEYEKAASDALGPPVKIGSARVSLITGVRLDLVNVSVGQAKIASIRAYPAVGSLFGENKSFSRIELEGAVIPQDVLAQAMLGKTKGANFQVGQVVARQLKLSGPVTLPAIDVDVSIGSDGAPSSISVRGADNLAGKLVPKDGRVEFELNANSFTLPIAPEIVLSQFGMKGSAGPAGMDIASWSGTLYDGVLSGTARLAWGSAWKLDGVVTVRGMNVAVFAPALLSEGKGEGTGRFSMSGADPAKLGADSRLEGNFTVGKGVLGSIDISRALQTGGRQSSGRTPFTEMMGQGTYDKGTISLRNITIGAGALNAGASADISQSGALTARIVADVKTASQTIRATLNVGGTAKEPQVRN